ncbi:TonB family protein [Larkinella soli]|uniref:TonB family protein n=1 Tax=Larkinella soli TaxID=1770527 RepID=UPI000FFC020D|nr:TonB family protein [Larkinella soli]
MNDPNRHSDSLTADDLRRYRAGELSPAEQHRVERLLLENPLYADALEGLDQMERQAVSPDRVRDDLRQRLKNRVERTPTRRLPLWLPAAAASVVLALSIGLYLRLQTQPEKAAGQNLRLSERPNPTTAPAPDPAVPSRPTLPDDRVMARRTPSKPQPERPGRHRDEAASEAPFPPATAPLPALPAPASAAPESTGPRLVSISGRVVGPDLKPLAGAVVSSRDGRRIVTTDTAGRFQFNLVPATDTLQFRYLGYQSESRPAGQVPAGDIRLLPDLKGLQESLAGVARTRVQQLQVAIPARTASARPQGATAPPDYADYLSKNRKVPAGEQGKSISGTVRVRFLVNPDGSLSRFSVVRSLAPAYDEEAVRLIREGPRWRPALENGRPSAQFAEQDVPFEAP